jgi:vacuolar-type H+-ATPase subunit H
MDDTLQRLLDAELRAEKIAQQAEAERERIIQGALFEARAEEDRFEARIPDLHASFIEKAQARAEQTVAELKRRYDERHTNLRTLADEREDDALEAAFALLIDADSDEH